MLALHLTRAVWATLCALGLSLGFADVSRAGTYLMRSCNVPGERSTSAAAWRWLSSPNTFANNDCSKGGGFGINAGPMALSEAAGIVIESPNGGTAIGIRRVRIWMVARLSGGGSPLFAASVSGAGGTATREDLFGPPGGDTLTTPYVSPLLAPNTGNYIIMVACSGSTPSGCAPANTNVLDIRGVEVTLEETIPPAVSVAGGDLLGVGPQSGIRSLTYAASDAESGVARVSAMLGGAAIGSSDLGTECPHDGFAACPQARTGAIAVDTRKVPDGMYPVALRVWDAAGNERTVQAATVVQVANSVDADTGSINGVDAGESARLTAWFAANRRATLTTTHDKRVVVRGRLSTRNGQAIDGARISVVLRAATRRPRSKTTTVVTAPDGSFSHAFAASTSGTVRHVYQPAANQPTSATRQLKLQVKAAATLRVALRGVSVRYHGRVLTRPVPSNGKVVLMQGRAPGGAWKTFAQRRTNRRGTFSGTYRLRVYRPGVRLQFRVRVPSQSGYPFVGHSGHALTRTVR